MEQCPSLRRMGWKFGSWFSDHGEGKGSALCCEPDVTVWQFRGKCSQRQLDEKQQFLAELYGSPGYLSSVHWIRERGRSRNLHGSCAISKLSVHQLEWLRVGAAQHRSYPKQQLVRGTGRFF